MLSPIPSLSLQQILFDEDDLVNIVILGPGAVGSLWALKLQQAGHKVALWARENAPTLSLQLDQGPLYSFANQSPQEIKHADLLLVTVKAWQVAEALAPLVDSLSSDSIIVLMHNGMGTAEQVAALLPANPLVIATTTHGAYKPSRQQVLHTGLGTTQLGGVNALGKQCAFLAEVFDHALPAVHWNEQIEHALWTKLAINCAINPLTAIHQCKNGQLADARFAPMLSEVCAELAAVMQRERIASDHADLLRSVMQVVEATAENYSSMQQDIYYQRKSEIDFINGYLLRCAAKHHIKTPHNQKLFEQIKQIEQSWTTS